MQLLRVPARLLLALLVHLLDLAHETRDLVTQLETLLGELFIESAIRLVFLLQLRLENPVEELAHGGCLPHVQLLLLPFVICVVALVFDDFELLVQRDDRGLQVVDLHLPHRETFGSPVRLLFRGVHQLLLQSLVRR